MLFAIAALSLLPLLLLMMELVVRAWLRLHPPHQQSPTMSYPTRRSRNGFAATSALASAMMPACRPRASSASNSSSTATAPLVQPDPGRRRERGPDVGQRITAPQAERGAQQSHGEDREVEPARPDPQLVTAAPPLDLGQPVLPRPMAARIADTMFRT